MLRKEVAKISIFSIILLISASNGLLAQNTKGDIVKDEHSQIGVEKQESKEHSMHPAAQWYPDAGLGLFLHWGISSVRAMGISWPMIPGRHLGVKRIENPQERERILRDMDYNLNGKKPEITPLEYWDMAKDFNPIDYNPDVWVKKAKEAGFTYIVLTTKHHEGFALWPSAYGDFSTKNYMGGKDLIRPFVEACHKEGLKVGLYYTGPDWYFDRCYMNFMYYRVKSLNPEFPSLGTDLKPRTNTINPDDEKEHQVLYAEMVKGQVEELLTNYGQIDLIWFDGKPGIPNADKVITQERIRELQPGILINPRLHGKGDFITYERNLPDKKPEDIRWAEFCNPWNGNWSFVDRPYKALGYVLSELVKCRAWGINYLLGIGPMANGNLAPEAYDNMQKLAEWMKLNKEAVQHVHSLPDTEKSSVLSAAKGNKRYLYLLPTFKKNGTNDKDILPNKDIVVTITGISRPQKVVFMLNRKNLKYDYSSEKSELTIAIPATQRSKLVDIISVYLTRNNFKNQEKYLNNSSLK